VLLIDASVWVASVTPANRWHEAADTLVRRPSQPLAALDLTLYEVANAIGVRCEDSDGALVLSKVIMRRCYRRMYGLNAELFDATLAIASGHGLVAYDAAYVAVARREGMTLVSIDIRDLVSKGLAVTPDAAV
jgi:predicted nucleic acid-binding protein